MSVTRRDFLRTSLAASTLAAFSSTAPRFLCRTATAAALRDSRESRDTVLVVLQLTGGNDGLNTVVPYGDDAYARNRPTLRLPPAKLHKIDTLLGFHPEMAGFHRLFQEGHLAIVQGVGYPSHSLQHPVAMRAWQTGRPEEPRAESGWVGRAADVARRPDVPEMPAVFVGPIDRPFGLNAQQTIVPAIDSLGDCRFRPVTEYLPSPRPTARVPRRGAGGEGGLPSNVANGRQIENRLLDFVVRSQASAWAVDRRIAALEALPSATADYPPFRLAASLRTVAELVRAECGIRAYYVELGGGGLGGFDNHAGQRDNHAALLRQLSGSVTAFCDDLKRKRLLDRVVLMTFSEFGRTVAENGRRGTDHGVAAPMFVVGGNVRGGLVGAHPSLTAVPGGGMSFHTDFRRVYATLLDQWLGWDSQAVLGARFQPLEILQG